MAEPFRSDSADISLEQVYTNQACRDVAELFVSTHYLHVVPQLIRGPDRSIGKTNDPFGGDFLEIVARTPEKTRNARLRRIRDALVFAMPQLSDLELVVSSDGLHP